jgi:tetratricopeptide (TPR) repeat protein
MTLPALLLIATAWAGDDFLTWLRKADRRDEPEEKIEYYTRAIAAWNESRGNALLAHCRHRRGEAYLLANDLDRAEEDLTKAVELDPRNGQAHLLKGRARFHRGRYVPAIADFSEFVALTGDPEGYLRRAQAEEKAGRLKAAQDDYKKAEQLDPEDYRPAVGRARVHLRGGDWKAALGALAAAEAKAGEPEPDLLAARSLTESQAGRPEAALKAQQEAVALYEDRLSGLKRAKGHAFDAAELSALLAEAAARLVQLEPKKAEPPPERPVQKKPKKRYPKPPSNDAGDRIYGS